MSTTKMGSTFSFYIFFSILNFCRIISGSGAELHRIFHRVRNILYISYNSVTENNNDRHIMMESNITCTVKVEIWTCLRICSPKVNWEYEARILFIILRVWVYVCSYICVYSNWVNCLILSNRQWLDGYKRMRKGKTLETISCFRIMTIVRRKPFCPFLLRFTSTHFSSFHFRRPHNLLWLFWNTFNEYFTSANY